VGGNLRAHGACAEHRDVANDHLVDFTGSWFVVGS
jgi:hypothetical protein